MKFLCTLPPPPPITFLMVRPLLPSDKMFISSRQKFVIALLVTGTLAGLSYFTYWWFTKGDGSLGGPYDKQAVATDTEECSDIGNDVLKEHGSAVDAAIAAMFCLGVINMHSSGVGGGGTMLVYNRTLKTAKVFDFRETASVTATQNMFQPNADGREKSQYGAYIY